MNPSVKPFINPFRPGAGHMPPYLAGRDDEKDEFRRLLLQQTILENLVLTGLRGLGKTVLLETFKPLAMSEGWLWAGADMSESSSLSEENLATRLLADLAVVTSSVTIRVESVRKYSIGPPNQTALPLNYATLIQVYSATPGLVADKLKGVLELVWNALASTGKRGIVFAYDEAQNLSDHAAKDHFPLSLLLDVFQSIQRKGIPFILALTGLPTLFPNLVEARTFSERMFRVITLKALSKQDAAAAMQRPLQDQELEILFTEQTVEAFWRETRGYPYFIQYYCRECFDVWVQNVAAGKDPAPIPIAAIIQKLDGDFFAGRWARATDRQRDLLAVIASLDGADDGEFTVQEVVERSGQMPPRPFSASHVNQMLGSLSDNGLIYKNRHGKYSFAVPLMGQFIRRQMADAIYGPKLNAAEAPHA